MKYTEPRYTKDIDIWIATDSENARLIFLALKEFGAPLTNLTEEDFAKVGYFYQMGRPPLRVDIMMSIPGVEFEQAWKSREKVKLGDLDIFFISKTDLIKAKLASGRPQDMIDADKLNQTPQP